MAIAREETLQIFQPAVDDGPVSWPITRKVEGLKLHRTSRDSRCRKGPDGKGVDQQPPCGNHIEIMARALLCADWYFFVVLCSVVVRLVFGVRFF